MNMIQSAATPAAQTPAKKPALVNDISHRAHNFARIMDRLRPGKYHIELVKDDVHAVDWDVVITRSELVQRVSLSNKSYVAE